MKKDNDMIEDRKTNNYEHNNNNNNNSFKQIVKSSPKTSSNYHKLGAK